MAVVPFSRMTSVRWWRLKTALMMPGMPAWKKVESPRNARTWRSLLNRASPEAAAVEAPMQSRTWPIW
jgi:hypothetical protein